MGSASKLPSFGRLRGEEVWFRWLVDGVLCEPGRGVSTSSALRASRPRRLTVCTSFSSRTVPFGLIFFGLDEWDMVGRCQIFRFGISTISPHLEKNPLKGNRIGAGFSISEKGQFILSTFYYGTLLSEQPSAQKNGQIARARTVEFGSPAVN